MNKDVPLELGDADEATGKAAVKVDAEVKVLDEVKEDLSDELVAVTSVGKLFETALDPAVFVSDEDGEPPGEELRMTEESTPSPGLGTLLELSSVENVESVIDEEETFALGTRVTKLAEDPGVSALLEGVLSELEDEKLEVRFALNEEASGGARGRDELEPVVDKGVDEIRLLVEKLAGRDDPAL